MLYREIDFVFTFDEKSEFRRVLNLLETTAEPYKERVNLGNNRF